MCVFSFLSAHLEESVFSDACFEVLGKMHSLFCRALFAQYDHAAVAAAHVCCVACSAYGYRGFLATHAVFYHVYDVSLHTPIYMV